MDTNPNSTDFIREIIAEDIKKQKLKVKTRFPPEPNGYLHIGHAKAICLNFDIARMYQGECNLRFDDTNPSKENTEYVKAIERDIHWLGFHWEENLYFASQYFAAFYRYAVELIQSGKAYVCSLSEEEIKEYRGTLIKPGKESPYRHRTIDENLALFQQMKNGAFQDGDHILRAKIDMAHPNLHMRDPIIYRIRHMVHHRTGTSWCLYPMYDFAHCLSDAIEGISHSLCTLEFEIHRPLYDWFLDTLKVESHPKQIEFARLNLSHTITSKRKLRELVVGKHVTGWDDPRMPTLCGLRRRGFTPESIREFCSRIGVTKYNGISDISLLEHCLREDLNKRAPRAMVVLRPLKVVILNYPEKKVEEIEAVNNPEDPSMGKRNVPFSKILYIERDDFCEHPPKKFFRLSPGKEVRLRYAYYIRCVDVIQDSATGEVSEVHCCYDPKTRGGWSQDGRKVKGTLHWVSAFHALPAEIRMYDRLFIVKDVGNQEKDFREYLNPNSLQILPHALAEASLEVCKSEEKFQFERQGYFSVESSRPLVFNRIVSLRDSWKKLKQKQ